MKQIIIKIFWLIIFLLTIIFILYHHYVEAGECATIVYYYPLGRRDYILIPLIGIIMLSLSLYFIPVSKKFRVTEVFIYVSLILITIIRGNDLLASRTIDWPDKYHPTLYEKGKRLNESQLIGAWTQQTEVTDPDGFLLDRITFEQDNLFFNGDNTYLYTYKIKDGELFIYRPNREVKIFKADVICDTLKLKLHKKAFFEIEIEPSEVLTSSQFSYIRAK